MILQTILIMTPHCRHLGVDAVRDSLTICKIGAGRDVTVGFAGLAGARSGIGWAHDD
jgi:hypothetical protein